MNHSTLRKGMLLLAKVSFLSVSSLFFPVPHFRPSDTKSTICDRLGYLDRARDLGTESCIPVHTKIAEFSSAPLETRRTRPRGSPRPRDTGTVFRAMKKKKEEKKAFQRK